MLPCVSFCPHWPGSQKTWVFISLHRLQIRHSKILLILARPLPIGYFTFYYFSFFLIFNWMDAWSLMRGDEFIHFVCGSRRVNIRLGVLLSILKSPHIIEDCYGTQPVVGNELFRDYSYQALYLFPVNTRLSDWLLTLCSYVVFYLINILCSMQTRVVLFVRTFYCSITDSEGCHLTKKRSDHLYWFKHKSSQPSQWISKHS